MTKKAKRTPAQRITRARSALVIFQPFYGTLLMNLEMVEDSRLPTMGTDGRQMLWNPAFVDRLTDAELLFVLSHEAAHCANLHQTRRRNRDPQMWNEAADYVINADLITAQIGQMPAKGLYDPRFEGLSTEDVYAMLADEAEQQAQSGQSNQPQPGQPQPGQSGQKGQPGQGQPGAGKPGEGDEGEGEGQDTGQGGSPATGAPEGAGEGQPGEGEAGDGQPTPGCGDPGGCGEVMDAPGSAGEVAQEEAVWETVVRQAVNVAAKSAGHMPAHLKRLISQMGKPQQNWREHMRRFVDQSNRFDYSWKKPDRRFSHTDYMMPGTVTDGINHVIIVRDTSGSINDTAVSRFNTEVQAMLDEGVVDRVTMIDCDAAIQSVATFEAGDLVAREAKGGGGTSFKPVWEWLKDNTEDAAALVYFTDLEPCDGFGKEPTLPVLWAAYRNSYSGPAQLRQRMAEVPFGECIEIAD